MGAPRCLAAGINEPVWNPGALAVIGITALERASPCARNVLPPLDQRVGRQYDAIFELFKAPPTGRPFFRGHTTDCPSCGPQTRIPTTKPTWQEANHLSDPRLEQAGK